MKIEFTTLEGEFPYQAKYIGYNPPAAHPRLGKGGNPGQQRRSYGELLEAVVRDLTGCPEKELEPVFHNDISPDLQRITKTLFDVLVKYNNSRGKLANIIEIGLG